MSRLRNAAPLLNQHDPTQHIGVIESADVRGGKGYAKVRFSKNPEADAVFRDVVDGIKPNVSVGYEVNDMTLVKKDGDMKTFRVTKWQPMEISMVSMPMDTSVGVGRADQRDTCSITFSLSYSDGDGDGDGNAMATPLDPSDPGTGDGALGTAQALVDTIQSKKAISMSDKAADTKAAEPEINIEQVRAQTITDERTRIKELSALGRQWNGRFSKEAERAISEDWTVAKFNDHIIREFGKTDILDAGAAVPNVNLNGRDASGYSLVKAIKQDADARMGRGRIDGVEAECNQEVRKRVPQMRNDAAQGFYIPEFALTRELRDFQKRDLSTLTGGAGAFTVESSVLGTELVALLRHRMYAMAAGARYLGGLQGNVLIPRHIGPGTAYWLAENASVTESDQSFGQLTLSPHTLMAQTKYSKQLLAQSSIDVEGLVRSDLNYIIAIALDLAALAGTGLNGQPIGIYNASSLAAQAGTDTTLSAITFGGTATWANVILMESLVASLDADVDNMAYITTPLARGKWKGNAKVSGFPSFLWESGGVKWDNGGKATDQGTVNGYRAYATNQLTNVTINAGTGAGTNANGCIFGNFNDLLIANWAGIDVVTDPYTAASTGEIVVTIHLMADIGIRRTKSFCVSTDTAAA